MSSTQLVKWLQSSHATENPTRASGYIFLVFWVKLRMEEEWMRSQFGETYATYARRTAALVPYLL
jgi:protein-S-isoprenylcysteine O-methyltransferase Ste14